LAIAGDMLAETNVKGALHAEVPSDRSRSARTFLLEPAQPGRPPLPRGVVGPRDSGWVRWLESWRA